MRVVTSAEGQERDGQDQHGGVTKPDYNGREQVTLLDDIRLLRSQNVPGQSQVKTIGASQQ